MKKSKFIILIVIFCLTFLSSSAQTFKDFYGMSEESKMELINAVRNWYLGNHSEQLKDQILKLMPQTINQYSLKRSDDKFKSTDDVMAYLIKKRNFSARQIDVIYFWEKSVEIGMGNYYQYNIFKPYLLSSTIALVVMTDKNLVLIVNSEYGEIILVNTKKMKMWKYYKQGN